MSIRDIAAEGQGMVHVPAPQGGRPWIPPEPLPVDSAGSRSSGNDASADQWEVEPFDDFAMSQVPSLEAGLMVVLAALRPDVIEMTEHLEIAGWRDERTRACMIRVSDVARGLATYMLRGKRPADAVNVRRRTRAAGIAAEALLDTMSDPIDQRRRLSAGMRDRFFARAAIEDHDAICLIEQTGGRLLLRWKPITREQALAVHWRWLCFHLDLIANERTLDRKEAEASSWYFFRHSIRDLEEPQWDDRDRRANQWILMDRQTLRGDTFLERFCRDPAFRHTAPSVQRLARKLRRREIGVFEIASVDGKVVRAQNRLTGRTRFLDAECDTPFQEGDLLLGTLMPDRPGWRSVPGTLLLRDLPPADRDGFAKQVERMARDIGLPLAIELTITVAWRGADGVPLDLPAFDSADAARVAFTTMITALVDARIIRFPPDFLDFGADGLLRDPSQIVIHDGSKPIFGGSRPKKNALDASVAEWLRVAQAKIADADGGRLPARPGPVELLFSTDPPRREPEARD